MAHFIRALFLFLAITAAWAQAARAEQVLATYVARDRTVTIDLADEARRIHAENPQFPVLAPDERTAKEVAAPLRGVAFYSDTKVTYKPLADRDGHDRIIARIGPNPEHVFRIEITVGQPEILSDDIYGRIGELLFQLLIVAIILEIALTFIFKNRRFQRINATAGIKSIVSFAAALLVVVAFKLNFFKAVVEEMKDQRFDAWITTWLSYGITALIVAGGSTTVYLLYTRLGIRPPTNDSGSGAGVEGEGTMVLTVKRDAAVQGHPVNVLLNDELVGIVPADEVKLGGDSGITVRAGAYVLKLTANTAGGGTAEANQVVAVEPGKPTRIQVEIG